jgi:hypothetical protein
MPKRGGAMHVATTRRHYNGKTYETHYVEAAIMWRRAGWR